MLIRLDCRATGRPHGLCIAQAQVFLQKLIGLEMRRNSGSELRSP